MTRLEGRVGTIRTPVSTPKIPRWLLYSGIGTAALGILAAGYLGLRSLGVPLPPQPRQAEQGQEQQYNPPQNGSEVTQQIPGIENVMSAEQVKATLEELLVTNRLITPEDADILKKAEAVNKSIYFMLTGKTFEQQKFVTKILPREEYDAVVHPNLKGTAGTIGLGEDGTTYIYSILTSPIYLISNLAHETGQAYAVREGPRNIDVGITKVDEALGDRRNEMLQALYRAAVFNKIRAFDIKSLAPPPLAISIEDLLSSDYFFAEAWAAAWGFALDDPEARSNLEATGWAGSEPLMRLFSYYALLDFKQNQKDENVRREAEFMQKLKTVLANKQPYAPLIKAAVEKRIATEGQRYIIGITDTLP